MVGGILHFFKMQSGNKVQRSRELFTHEWLTCSILMKLKIEVKIPGVVDSVFPPDSEKQSINKKKHPKEDIIELAYNFLNFSLCFYSLFDFPF